MHGELLGGDLLGGELGLLCALLGDGLLGLLGDGLLGLLGLLGNGGFLGVGTLLLHTKGVLPQAFLDFLSGGVGGAGFAELAFAEDLNNDLADVDHT